MKDDSNLGKKESGKTISARYQLKDTPKTPFDFQPSFLGINRGDAGVRCEVPKLDSPGDCAAISFSLLKAASCPGTATRQSMEPSFIFSEMS
jgi:hypothetical protein